MMQKYLPVIYITVPILSLVLIWLIIKVVRLEKVRKEFFASGIKKDLEGVLVDQNRSLTKINKEINKLNKTLSGLSLINENNLQKIGFIRFNPFADTGSNMSFSLALLDAHHNGITISSLHGREGTRIYAKAISNGRSESKLTEEEVEAIKNAK